jgi:nitroimidazol reductase NimA-like FMN-containing flavoprotein (pyridoxamine 5'-phosphate oxidase superfamily)
VDREDEVNARGSRLSEAQCWDCLRRVPVARLAVVLDGEIQLRPMNFAVDHGTLLVRTATGSTLARTDGHAVVVEADSGFVPSGDERPREAWSVIVRGDAHLVTDRYELLDTIDVSLLPWEGSDKPHFLRIAPRSITGRAFSVADPARWTN